MKSENSPELVNGLGERLNRARADLNTTPGEHDPATFARLYLNWNEVNTLLNAVEVFVMLQTHLQDPRS
jgi:hypothetical protein